MSEKTTERSAAFGSAGKNILVAYLLWWFLGGLGLHRFYLDRPVSGLIMILLLIFGWIPLFIGWIVLAVWWLLDAYFVYRYTTDYNAASGGSPLSFTLRTGKSVKGDLHYLEKLADLRDRGVITEVEFLRRKADIL